jgi:dUTP pyrophosphatase
MKIKLLTETAQVPTKGSLDAAGYDLYIDMPELRDDYLTIMPHSTVKIPTGIAIEIPTGFFGAIFARSGTATKKGLRPANCVGVIDADYRGPIIVALHNDTDEVQLIADKERIAQIVFLPVCDLGSFEIVDELSDTTRGGGGFGSTGSN